LVIGSDPDEITVDPRRSKGLTATSKFGIKKCHERPRHNGIARCLTGFGQLRICKHGTYSSPMVALRGMPSSRQFTMR